MKGKTKKKKTLNRQRRLLLAKDWLPTYTGKKIVRAYAKKYRTDLPTAVLELRMLGVEVSGVYEEALKKTLAAIAEQRRQKKEEKMNAHLEDIEQDFYHAHIMGYTSGGAAYGITWDELTEEEREFYRYKIPGEDDVDTCLDF